jgi:hypothetical protein
MVIRGEWGIRCVEEGEIQRRVLAVYMTRRVILTKTP